jgi:hypothetical protein
MMMMMTRMLFSKPQQYGRMASIPSSLTAVVVVVVVVVDDDAVVAVVVVVEDCFGQF